MGPVTAARVLSATPRSPLGRGTCWTSDYHEAPPAPEIGERLARLAHLTAFAAPAARIQRAKGGVLQTPPARLHQFQQLEASAIRTTTSPTGWSFPPDSFTLDSLDEAEALVFDVASALGLGLEQPTPEAGLFAQVLAEHGQSARIDWLSRGLAFLLVRGHPPSPIPLSAREEEEQRLSDIILTPVLQGRVHPKPVTIEVLRQWRDRVIAIPGFQHLTRPEPLAFLAAVTAAPPKQNKLRKGEPVQKRRIKKATSSPKAMQSKTETKPRPKTKPPTKGRKSKRQPDVVDFLADTVGSFIRGVLDS